MTPRRGILLAVIGAIVLAGGWYASRPDPGTVVQSGAGSLVFPGLAAKLENAARIDIATGDKKVSIVRAGDAWGVAERDGYPVMAGKLRALLTGLTELRLVEPRTADPAQYGRLGVEDPSPTAADATSLRVLDAKGAPLAELILGHRRTRTAGNLPESIYIRRPGDAQSWLAEGRVEADADLQSWFDRDIISIAPDKITAVTATRGEDKLVFARQDGKLVLTEPAEHPALDEQKVQDVARGLDSLTFMDVQPAAAMTGDKMGKPLGSSVFTDDEGTTVTVTLSREGADHLWARFAASGKQADGLNTRLGKWVYELGTWKEKAILPALSDLAAPPPPPAKPTQ